MGQSTSFSPALMARARILRTFSSLPMPLDVFVRAELEVDAVGVVYRLLREALRR